MAFCPLPPRESLVSCKKMTSTSHNATSAARKCREVTLATAVRSGPGLECMSPHNPSPVPPAPPGHAPNPGRPSGPATQSDSSYPERGVPTAGALHTPPLQRRPCAPSPKG